MTDKRCNKRYPIDLKLKISTLFKQDNVKVDNIDAPIDVLNISRGGIGFQSESYLPKGFYFNAKIQLGEEDSKLYTVVQIVHQEKRENSYYYGAEFIGMPSVLMYIFDEYEGKFNKEAE